MNIRIRDVLTSLQEVKEQFNNAQTPMDKLDAYDRMLNLYTVLELECELFADEQEALRNINNRGAA
jgi:hypothetical protein